jgi:hypothetical protein
MPPMRDPIGLFHYTWLSGASIRSNVAKLPSSATIHLVLAGPDLRVKLEKNGPTTPAS